MHDTAETRRSRAGFFDMCRLAKGMNHGAVFSSYTGKGELSMKKLSVVFALLLLLTGCGKTVDLMPGANPESSALALYVYDGRTITRQFLFDTETEKEVLQSFRNVKDEPVEVDVVALEPPFYGLEIGAEDGRMVCGLWSDGYFLMDNGGVYRLEYDFAALQKNRAWEEAEVFSSLTVMPCASRVAKTEAGWNPFFLTPSSRQEAPSGITMELAGQTAEAVTVRFTNRSGVEWGYGYAYRLQVRLDGAWYEIPAEREMAFPEILMLLPDGESAEQTCSLEPYGSLPAGVYRVVMENMTAEFTME